jgi:hypothetical protein
MNTKQTAVEWLYERLERMIPRSALYNIDKREYLEQALEMEKEQHEDSYWEFKYENFEQYYKETYDK